jgi:hypothetical protein
VRRTRQQRRDSSAFDLRKEAAHRSCQIRLPGCVSEPTCLCHFRLSGISGMGLKSPDWLGAWGCAHCHAIVDGTKDAAVQLDFAHAVFRTQYELDREGKLRA